VHSLARYVIGRIGFCMRQFGISLRRRRFVSSHLSPGGILSHSGSDDDSRVYLPLEDFVHLTGVHPHRSCPVEAPSGTNSSTFPTNRSALPNAEVKPVRQITRPDPTVFRQTRSVRPRVVCVRGRLNHAFHGGHVLLTAHCLSLRARFCRHESPGSLQPDRRNFLFASDAALLAPTDLPAGMSCPSVSAF